MEETFRLSAGVRSTHLPAPATPPLRPRNLTLDPLPAEPQTLSSPGAQTAKAPIRPFPHNLRGLPRSAGPRPTSVGVEP